MSKSNKIKQWLLCSDLDRTLIPNGIQPESPHARSYFKQLIEHEAIMLCYVTGRDKKLVNEAITYYNLPKPDFVIADVGATIYQLSNQNNDKDLQKIHWQPWQEWVNVFSHDWKGKTNQDIATLFSDITEIRKQEISKQKTYKLSYYVPLYLDHYDLLTTMRHRLSHSEIKAELIWSIDEPAGIGLLDVMPEHATKRYAIEFLMTKNNFNHSNTLFAGDSGNDLDALLSPLKSILVANAHPDIKKIVEKEIARHKPNNTVYIAQGGFKNMNGNYSSGVLEGIIHYFPEIEPLIQIKE